jgi:hypothetical protein
MKCDEVQCDAMRCDAIAPRAAGLAGLTGVASYCLTSSATKHVGNVHHLLFCPVSMPRYGIKIIQDMVSEVHT